MNATYPRALIALDSAVTPVAALSQLQWNATFQALPQGLSDPAEGLGAQEAFDLFVLLVSANSGISKSMIDLWHFFQDRQIPRLMLVQDIESSNSDFDDIVLIGNRILEKFATPYLVLHHEDGSPIGLIDIVSSQIRDYSNNPAVTTFADEELQSLVKEFQEEYLVEFAELGESGFSAGLYPVALPITGNLAIGVTEINLLLATLSTPGQFQL